MIERILVIGGTSILGESKTTFFAVKLNLAPSGGKLKPGMPADVHLQMSR